jgi:hypothetical protein
MIACAQARVLSGARKTRGWIALGFQALGEDVTSCPTLTLSQI